MASLNDVLDSQQNTIDVAKKMLLLKVTNGMTNDMKVLVKLNNDLIENFFNTLVIPLNKLERPDNPDTIYLNRTWQLWAMYYDGVMTRKTEGYIHKLSDQQRDEYRMLLNRDVATLFAIGLPRVMDAYQKLTSDRDARLTDLKLQMIYTSDNPLDWIKAELNHKDKIIEMDNQIWPLIERDDIRKKINALNNVRITGM